jgi:hypothetical protein
MTDESSAFASASPLGGGERDVFTIKQVKYMRSGTSQTPDTVGILLQASNGPCPLIALFNILLLRGNLSLPAGAGEVPASRVVAMLAEYLLDKNEAMLNSAASESVKADLRYNLADAISLIPTLMTGIDVNVRFNDIRGVEYTQALCVFDLLGIDLVHGWVVDPQDVETARALGDRTYNELAYNIITALEGGGHGGAAEEDHAGVRSAITGTIGSRIRRTSSDVPSTPPSHKGSVAKEELVNILESMSWDQPSMDGLPGMSQTRRSSLSEELSREGSLLPGARRTSTGVSSLISQDSLGRAITSLLDETVSGAFVSPRQMSGTLPAAVDGTGMQVDPVENDGAGTRGGFEDVSGSEKDDRSEVIKSALVAKDFLESTSSQLTYHGITSLQEGLLEGQLAVFFRNNHFNVLLKKRDQLYILVTDQGYQNEADIVWEQLSAVDNDTEFVGWSFGPFSPHAEVATGFVDPDQEDADFKLAQQLQLEEDARARRHALDGVEQAREDQAAQRARRKKEKKEKKSICSVM